MPGYFETVIADAIRSGGVIFLPTQIGITWLPSNLYLWQEVLHLGTTGPDTVGWDTSDPPGSTKDFDIDDLFPDVVPLDAKSLVVEVSNYIEPNATDPFIYMKTVLYNTAFGVLPGYFAAVETIGSNAADAGNGGNHPTVTKDVIVTVSPTDRILRGQVIWSTTIANAGGTTSSARILGYSLS